MRKKAIVSLMLLAFICMLGCQSMPDGPGGAQGGCNGRRDRGGFRRRAGRNSGQGHKKYCPWGFDRGTGRRGRRDIITTIRSARAPRRPISTVTIPRRDPCSKSKMPPLCHR